MKAAFLIILVLLAGLASSPALAQAEASRGAAWEAFLKRRAAGQVDPAFAEQVLRQAQALEAQGLPAEPYLLKVNEGLAKKVAPKKMAPALEQTAARTRSAGVLVERSLGPGASLEGERRRLEILRVQSALNLGESPEKIERKIRSGAALEKRPAPEAQAPHPKKAPGYDKKAEKTQPAYRKPEKQKGPKPHQGPAGQEKNKKKGQGRGKGKSL